MIRRNFAALIAASACFTTGVAQAGTLYTIFDTGPTDVLASINTTTYGVSIIGDTGVGGSFGDLAYDSSSSTMYWVAGRGNDNLYTVNLTTGAATLVGSHGINDLFSLGWNGSGLYAQDTGGTVYSLNAATAVATVIGGNSIYPGGFDYNTTTGKMISIGAGSGNIHSINLADGSATFLGGSDYVNDADIAYDVDSNVYWVADYNQSLYKYDATTLARTTVLDGTLGGYTGSLEYVGGIAPIPEPETYAMMLAGLGLLGVVARRRKQKRNA